MAETKTGSGTGLEGVVAGRSAVATVGKKGRGLRYRGYAIEAVSYTHLRAHET